ncbi:glycosyltransferase family 4 protein [Tardisphaera miroshnichenkoae]
MPDRSQGPPEWRPLNVLWINHRDPKHPRAGGAEVHLIEIGKRLVARGHAVTLLCERWPGSAREEIIEGVRVKRYGGPIALHAISPFFAATSRADVIVDDVAHAVPFFSNLFARRPVVAVVHHVSQEVLDRELPFPLSWAAKRAERGVRLYRSIVTVSEASKSDLVGKLGVRPERITVISEGVDLSKYSPGKKAEVPTFLWLGRIKRYKNADHAVRAVSAVRGARLIVAGAGDPDEVSRLRSLVRELGAEDRVQFMGWVSEEEKARLYAESWAFLMTSSVEGFGLVVVEAAASGTPTLAYDEGPMREVIEDGRTGFLVPFGDVGALSEKVAALSSDHSLAERMGMEARQFSKRFDWDAAADEFERALLMAAGRRRAPGPSAGHRELWPHNWAGGWASGWLGGRTDLALMGFGVWPLPQAAITKGASAKPPTGLETREGSSAHIKMPEPSPLPPLRGSFALFPAALPALSPSRKP